MHATMQLIEVALAMPTATELTCAALRGERVEWPKEVRIGAMLDEVRAHGVAALLYRHARSLDWPVPIVDRLRAEAIALAAWELQHQQVLTRVVAALAAAGIEPVLLKGTALAYSLYPDAALRTRGDTDLIVPIAMRERTGNALREMGFHSLADAGGEVASYQSSYVLDDNGQHCLDVHWRINNSELLARLFTYEELRRDARPLPLLAPHALGTGPVHSFLFACMHRGTHRQNPYYVDGVAHYEADRLVWLYDIHLLALSFDTTQWRHAIELANAKGLHAVCLESVVAAQARFGTVLPNDVSVSLTLAHSPEAPALYLASGRLRQQWMDFCALGSIRRRWQWAHDLVFPDRTYMLRKYAGMKLRWLPWLYARRAASGVVRNLLRARARS